MSTQDKPEVDTSPEKLRELAEKENREGVVDQQTAAAAEALRGAKDEDA